MAAHWVKGMLLAMLTEQCNAKGPAARSMTRTLQRTHRPAPTTARHSPTALCLQVGPWASHIIEGMLKKLAGLQVRRKSLPGWAGRRVGGPSESPPAVPPT